MKMQVKIWMALCAIAAVAACSKDDQSGTVSDPENLVPGERVTIRAGIPDALTKVSMNPESDPDGGLLLAWEADDKIRVISSSGNEVFDISSFEGHEATFSGKAVGGSSFDVLYPGTYADVAAAEAGVGSYQEQTQAGNASSAHLQYTALLSGVDSYNDVLFTEAWASAHGGTFKQSGALRIRFQLPDAAVSVTEATVTAGARSVKVTFSGNADISADHILTFYANLPWEAFTLGEEEVIEVKVVTADHDVYHKSFTPTGKTFEPGRLNAVKLSKKDVVLEDFAGGTGVDGNDPWLIGNKRQMQNIAANLEANETKYFKLIDDIDMTDVSWASLNAASPYNKKIDFDGNYKTISNLSCSSEYPAFIGILVGAAKDLTIDQATITAGTKRGGIFANYVGHSDAGPATVTNVHVANSSVTGTGSTTGGFCSIMQNSKTTVTGCSVEETIISGAQYTGGFAGSVGAQNIVISDCTVTNVAVTGTYDVGGFAGVFYGKSSACSVIKTKDTIKTGEEDVPVLVKGTGNTNNHTYVGGFAGFFQYGQIKRCYASVPVDAKYRAAGGLVGFVQSGSTPEIENSCALGDVSGNMFAGGLVGMISGACTVSNCFASGSVSVSAGNGGAGGLVGEITLAGASVQKCVAWSPSVTGTDASGSWSSAAVVGVAFPTCTLTDNYRKSDMTLTAWWVPDAEFQHANVSSSNKLMVKDKSTNEIRQTTATSLAAGQDNRPQYAYHGKVDASKTLSELTRDVLGWDASVWNFPAGDALPTLK